MRVQSALRHAFRYKLKNGKEIARWFKVIPGSENIVLRLLAEHVEESIRRNGVGDTQNCSMAVCAQTHESVFSHAVEGTIDWYPSRCYVVSAVYPEPRRFNRTSKKFIEGQCVAYEHNSPIWKFNDNKEGQKKLLKLIKEAGGHIDVHLRPWRKQTQGTAHRASARDGSRVKNIKKRGGAGRIAYVLEQLASAA